MGIQCQTMQQDVRWGDQQWRQEVKIAPASRPDPQSPIPGRALGSAPGAILGPGRVILPGGRSPPTPPITPFLPPSSSSSSCRSLLSLQRKEGRVEWENQEGRGWGGQGVSRAGSLMPATPGQVQ